MRSTDGIIGWDQYPFLLDGGRKIILTCVGVEIATGIGRGVH